MPVVNNAKRLFTSPRASYVSLTVVKIVLYTHNHSHNHIIITMISQSNGTCTNSNTGYTQHINRRTHCCSGTNVY